MRMREHFAGLRVLAAARELQRCAPMRRQPTDRPTDPRSEATCLLLKASVMMMIMISDAVALLIVLMHAALPRFASSETLTRENFVRAGAHLKRARRTSCGCKIQEARSSRVLTS